MRLNTHVASIDIVAREVGLSNGARIGFDALLLATGADPVRLAIPGADFTHVHYLRTLDYSRALIANVSSSRRAVIVGASFIGLETAAAPRMRGVVFQLGMSAAAIENDSVKLNTKERLAADVVVVGIGVRPNSTLAHAAGLKVDDGYRQSVSRNKRPRYLRGG